MAEAGTDHSAGNSTVSLAETYMPGRSLPSGFGKSTSVRSVRDPGSSDHATNGAHSKAPEDSTGGFVAQNRMAVQPPKKEDLQKSYGTIVAYDASPKGAYAKMSMFASDAASSTPPLRRIASNRLSVSVAS